MPCVVVGVVWCSMGGWHTRGLSVSIGASPASPPISPSPALRYHRSIDAQMLLEAQGQLAVEIPAGEAPPAKDLYVFVDNSNM